MSINGSPTPHSQLLLLAEELGSALVSEVDELRSGALQQLVEAIKEKSETPLQQNEITALSGYFTEKLKDRACIHAALQGCLALMEISTADVTTRSRVPIEQVEKMEKTLLRELPIAHLSQGNRQSCFQLLDALIQHYGEESCGRGLKLLDDVEHAVEGERDPRCLLVSLQLIRSVVRLYGAAPQRQHQLAAKAEDLCEAVTCYFPATFRLPPDSEHEVTRADLAAALEATICCTPLFAPFVYPLLLEKLLSAVWQAKVDAMSVLGACVEAWGASSMSSFSSQFWWALKEEVESGTVPDPGEGGVSTAVAACDCLRRCLSAESRDSAPDNQLLLRQMLQDECVADVGQWLAETSSAGESVTTAKRFALSNSLLSAAAGASPLACRDLIQHLGSTLLTHLQSGEKDPGALALSSLSALLKGAAEGFPSWQSAADLQPLEAEGILQGLGSKVFDSILQPHDSEGWAIRWKDSKRAQLEIRVLAQLASFNEGTPQALNGEQMRAALSALCDVASGTPESPLVAEEVLVGFAAVAGAGQQTVIADLVLPQLLTADAVKGKPRDSLPLACLVAISKAGQTLRPKVLDGLTEAVLGDLREAPGDGMPLLEAPSPATARLEKIAHEIFEACGGPLSGAEAAAALRLTLGLVAAAQVKKAGTMNASDALFLAAASAVREGTARCGAEEQQAIAATASATLVQAMAVDQPSRAWSVLVSCAALLALRPGVAPGGQGGSSIEVLQAVLLAALDVPDDEAACVAMAAAASLLLKWPAGGDQVPESVDEAVSLALDETVLPKLQLHLEKDAATGRLRAISLLGWVLKGLAMRRHPSTIRPLDTVIAYLEAASLDLASTEEGTTSGLGSDQDPSEWEDVFDAEEARAMARVLHTMLDPGNGVSTVDRSVHAVGRVLWQQKAFTDALDGLEEKLHEGQNFLGRAPTPLLLAVARLAGACPANILMSALPRLLPWLLAGLEKLREGSLADGAALTAILAALKLALAHEKGKFILEEHANQLIATLLATAQHKPDANARISALACLAEVAKPDIHLAAHRRRVLQVLALAVDDSRRAVRAQAAKTRQMWMPLPL